MKDVLLQLEKKARGKISGIKNCTITPQDSGIGIILNKIKELDEPLYNSLLEQYKKVLKDLVVRK